MRLNSWEGQSAASRVPVPMPVTSRQKRVSVQAQNIVLCPSFHASTRVWRVRLYRSCSFRRTNVPLGCSSDLDFQRLQRPRTSTPRGRWMERRVEQQAESPCGPRKSQVRWRYEQGRTVSRVQEFPVPILSRFLRCPPANQMQVMPPSPRPMPASGWSAALCC